MGPLGQRRQPRCRPAAGRGWASGFRATRCHSGVMSPDCASASRVPFDQVSVGDRARARRLTSPALHAGLERSADLRGDRRTVVLHRAHRRDPPAGRLALVAGDPVRRAVRQAQARTGRSCSARRRRGRDPRQRLTGSRPGLSRPVGSNPCFTRAPRSRRAAGIGWAAGCGFDANTVPTPTDATNGPASWRAASASSPGGSDHRSRRQGRRPGRHRPTTRCGPTRARSASTSAACPSSSIHVRARPTARRTAVCSHGVRGERVDVGGLEPRSTRPGRGWCAGSPRRCSPSVPSAPTMSRGRSNPVTFFTVGPPPVMTRPSADTYRTCSTAERTRPRPRTPDAFSPTASAPPTVPPRSGRAVR